MKNKIEKIETCQSYIDGEDFLCSFPEDILAMSVKKDEKTFYHSGNELFWDPWPSDINVERRIGPWVLLKEEGNLQSKVFGENVRVIRKHDDKVWYVWSFHHRGKFYRDLFYGELIYVPLYGNAEKEKIQDPDKEVITKVFGKNRKFPNSYFMSTEKNRYNQALIDLEWYRKLATARKRKISLENKKKLAIVKGISLQELNVVKREEKQKKKRIARTQQWVTVANDVYSSYEFLQTLIKTMTDDREFSQEWFDEGRRKMRALSTTLRPMRTHFPKKSKIL